MPTATMQFVNELEAMRKRIDNLARTPQLTSSSIDDGTLSLTTGGALSGELGTVWDGSVGVFALSSPTPPIPSGISMKTVPGGVEIRWDGTFENNAITPMGFQRVEIHVSDDAGLTGIEFATMHSSMTSPRGGTVNVRWPENGTPLYCRLVARSNSGKPSLPSVIVGPVVSGYVGLANMGFNVEDYAGGKTIFYGQIRPTAPTGGFAIGDVWLRLDVPGDSTVTPPIPPKYTVMRWDGVDFYAVQVQGLAESLAQAIIAQQAADEKSATYVQDTAPEGLTPANDGDTWMNPKEGNKVRVWGRTTTLERMNLVINPSFEHQDTGVVDSFSNYLPFTGGTVGTVSRSISGTAVGAPTNARSGAKHARIVASSLGTLTGDRIGLLQTWKVSADPGTLSVGDVLRGQANIWVTTPSTDHPVVFYMDALNSTGGIVTGAQTKVGAGTTGRHQLVIDFTVPADAVTVRMYVWRRGNNAGVALANADLNTDAWMLERNRVAGATTAYFDGGTGGEAIWNGTANLSPSQTWESPTGTAWGWQERLVRAGAIQPKSLVASNIIATGTVSAALLEAVLVLASRLVAGDLDGNHSAMEPDGFHIYQLIPGEGIIEVARLATSSSDYFGLVDSTGRQVVSIDDTGTASFQEVITESLVVNGTNLAVSLANKTEGIVGRFTGVRSSGDIWPIVNEYGICEVVAPVVAGRAYRVDVSYTWKVDGAIGDEGRFRVRSTWGASGDYTTMPPAPTITSYEENVAHHTAEQGGRWYDATDSFVHYPSVSSLQRFLFTAQKGALKDPAITAGYVVIVQNPSSPAFTEIDFTVTDLGPVGVGSGGQFTAGGGTLAGTGGTANPNPGSVQTQYSPEIAPNGTWTYRGDDSLRTDTSQVVQGWDPSGFNGDGKGHWRFPLPSITGTVDRVDLYLYSDHWYYASGGTAIINIISNTGVANPTKLRGDYLVGGYVRAGGKWITLPSDWWPFFKNGGTTGSNRVAGIHLGRSGNTNTTYYGRFNGGAPRLRIWYTQ